MARKKEMTKDDVIKKEIKRLKKIYSDLEGKKKQVVDGLINEAAFMKATLEELKVIIDEKGPLDEMVQGDYSILREHPAVKTYNTMIQRYSTVVKQLADLMPKEEPKEPDDGFESFVNDRD